MEIIKEMSRYKNNLLQKVMFFNNLSINNEHSTNEKRQERSLSPHPALSS
jgi:hypothetical protein